MHARLRVGGLLTLSRLYVASTANVAVGSQPPVFSPTLTGTTTPALTRRA